jgi:hypothetical protein
MPLVTTKNRGISHLTTGCLRPIHVRYGALNGLKSEIDECPKSGTRTALDIDEAPCLRWVIRRQTPPSQQNCNSQHLSYGFALTTTLGCRSRGMDWIMIRILQDQENGHRNNCTSRFRVRDRRCRGQDLRMAPGRSIWPIHRSTFGPKWVTGLAELAARQRT